MKKFIQFFSLFGSLGTLFCCALPITFVSLGMGAAFASITALFPQVNWILKYKTALFIITAILIIVSYILIRRSRKLDCETQGDTNIVCEKIKPKTEWIFWMAVITYIIGLFFSYILPQILY